MSFAHPFMLLLLIPLAFSAWRMLRRGRKRGIRFPALSRVPTGDTRWRAILDAATPFVFLLAVALLVLAAARPRTPRARNSHEVDAIAIAMTIDVSGSMRADDIHPTRLDAVKRLFREFVDKRPDDLIGLVTFGGYASAPSPLTADHDALKRVLDAVKIPEGSFDALGRLIGEDERMTSMGDGIGIALARLKEAKPKTKIIILLSDGASNTGVIQPEDAARLAAKMGVKIYIVGIGTVPEVLEVRTLFGVERYPTADMPYERLVEVLGFDERQLQAIAKETGGAYYPVSDLGGIEKALAEINELETTRLEAESYDRWHEHFTVLLLAGAALIFVAVSLSMLATRRLA